MNVRLISSQPYYRRGITRAFDNFEYHETTLSHTLRNRHSALQNRSFGEAFFEALKRHGAVGAFRDVLEIGGGCGDFASAFIRAWSLSSRRHPRSYTLIDLSHALLNAQKQKIHPRRLKLNLVQGDAQHLPLKVGSFSGVVIANEVIADLDTWQLGVPAAKNGKKPMDAAMVKRYLHRYRMGERMRKHNAVFPFGFVRLLEQLHPVIHEGSRVILTEYFDHEGLGRINPFDEHTETAISLELAGWLAQQIGFSVRVMSLADFLDLQVTKAVPTKRFGLFMRQVLGHPASITHPPGPRQLARWLGNGFRGETDGWCSRAELQNLASVFYLIILTRRNRINAGTLTEAFIPRKEPAVRRLVSKKGVRFLVTAYPLTCKQLNETGDYLWRSINGKRTAAQLAAGLAKRYAISARQAGNDTLAFLRLALRYHYLY